jgi:hypothetical protein
MNTETCSICMDSLTSNKVELDCSHKFHYSCLFKWNKYHTNCPYCRSNINDINETENCSTNENLDINYFINHKDLYCIDINCKTCHSELRTCIYCDNSFCNCNYNRSYGINNRITYINGCNPFENEENKETCLECFSNKEELLTDLLYNGEFWEDNLESDIYDNEELLDIYNKFYKNNSGIDYYEDTNLSVNFYTNYTITEFERHVSNILTQTFNLE